MVRIVDTLISGCKIIECDRHFDSRGQFQELFEENKYAEVVPAQDHSVKDGIFTTRWKQANWSVSNKNVLRGIHVANYAKLVTCITGAIWDFVVDFRKNSPTFLQHVFVELNAGKPSQIFVPHGCGHGFVSLEQSSSVVYLQTNRYADAGEITVKYSDPLLNIKYPGENWIISDRDLNAISVEQLMNQMAASNLN